MAGAGWEPSAALAALERRAALLAQLRAFFAARGVLELEVPLLGRAGVTDVHIENPVVPGAPEWYLQSSPEYFLKRFLARHARAVYYLGKAFRAGERGRLHQPEFTLLEWYRPGWDDDALIAEVAELLAVSGAGPVTARWITAPGSPRRWASIPMSRRTPNCARGRLRPPGIPVPAGGTSRAASA